MKNITIKYIGLYTCLAGLVSLTACDNYLDKLPDNRTVIDSPEAVSELLVSAYPNSSYYGFTEAMTDNIEDKGVDGLYRAYNSDAFFWKDHSDNDLETPEAYWYSCYEAVAHCNQALEAIENAENPLDYSSQKGEALVARAYAHFMLANLWCKPYNPATAKTDLGIPYVKESEKVAVKDYDRGTLMEVYDNIRIDLEAGLPLVRDEKYVIPSYHFTISAANAFASRFYLFTGDWKKAEEAANKVLNADPAKQLRDWNGAYAPMTASTLLAYYTKAEESANLLLTSTQSMWGRDFARVRYGFSTKKQTEIFTEAKLFSAKWAFKFYTRGSGNNLFIPKFEEFFRYVSVNATTGYVHVMAPIFTIEEVLLNRAEALFMQQGGTSLAMADVNTYLSKRIKDYDVEKHSLSSDTISNHLFTKEKDPTPLKPFFEISDAQKPFIKLMLDLRRREFLFEGLRWFDIRRYRLPVIHTDVDEQNYELSAEDPRKVLQLPAQAIINGMTPNPKK